MKLRISRLAGSRAHRVLRSPQAGSIPARAGQPRPAPWRRWGQGGPSPFARGSRASSPPAPGARRSIPARAGQPAAGNPQDCGHEFHPRSRGAASVLSIQCAQALGPSPLARGSRGLCLRRVRHGRSIPARAGQPPAAIRGTADRRVHPRSRGAAAFISLSVDSEMGPSPLARGSRVLRVGNAAPIGSIPARAGQPALSQRAQGPVGVHPRSRGAAPASRVSVKSQPGPSPLARGSHAHGLIRRNRRGSIPARAGQPRTARTKICTSRVHPRSRGAARRRVGIPRRKRGPSPLARGSLARLPALRVLLGSIPARAGQPPCRTSACPTSPVHPRSRGAAADADTWAADYGGPSPLARGSRDRRSSTGGQHGSIPARAGQPLLRSRPAPRSRVHPRSRGAATRNAVSLVLTQGPSPLARGSLHDDDDGRVRRGSIPARAGQPFSAGTTPPWCWVHPRSRGAAVNLTSGSVYPAGPSPLARGSL